MPLAAPRVGQVIPYWYLWRHEHEIGEDAGRKLRPCIVVVSAVRVDAAATRIAVVPVTHTAPDLARDAVELPTAVKAHLGLDTARSWVICDEFNEFDWPGFDLGKTPAGLNSFGFLPRGVIADIRNRLMAARSRGRLRGTTRDA